MLLLWSNSGWSRVGGGGDICSPPLLQDQMESFAELICGRTHSTREVLENAASSPESVGWSGS